MCSPLEETTDISSSAGQNLLKLNLILKVKMSANQSSITRKVKKNVTEKKIHMEKMAGDQKCKKKILDSPWSINLGKPLLDGVTTSLFSVEVDTSG